MALKGRRINNYKYRKTWISSEINGLLYFLTTEWLDTISTTFSLVVQRKSYWSALHCNHQESWHQDKVSLKDNKKKIMHLQNHSTSLCKQQQYYIFICKRQVLKYQYHFELRKTSESIHTAVILITTTWIQSSCQNWNGFFSTKPY